MNTRPRPADNGSDETLLDWPERFVDSLNMFYTPILVFFGTLGNILSIVAFFGSTLRHLSTSRYLSALAISDTLYLIQIYAVWLHTMQIWDLFVWDIFCQVFMYASYVSCNLSAWLVVAFTVERYVAVSHPLRRASICTLGRAHSVICGLVFISLAINAPVVWFAQPNDECTINKAYYEHAVRFNAFDSLVSFTLPLAAICVLNHVISRKLRETQIVRAMLLRETRSCGGGPPQRSQYAVTNMLLVVSSVFVILNLPAYVLRLVIYTKKEYSKIWVLTQRVCTLIFNGNFGINFILYCYTGQNFRRALRVTLFPSCFGRRGYGGAGPPSHPTAVTYSADRGGRAITTTCALCSACATRCFIMYGSESWIMQKKDDSKLNAVEMRSLRNICGKRLRDRIKNEDIRRERDVEESVIMTRLSSHVYFTGHESNRLSDTRSVTPKFTMSFNSHDFSFDRTLRRKPGFGHQVGADGMIVDPLATDLRMGRHVVLLHSPPSGKKNSNVQTKTMRLRSTGQKRIFKTDLDDIDEIKPYVEETPKKTFESNLGKEIVLTQSWLDIYSQLGYDDDDILKEQIAAEISASEAYSKRDPRACAGLQEASTSSRNRLWSNGIEDHNASSNSGNSPNLGSGSGGNSHHSEDFAKKDKKGTTFKPFSVIGKFRSKEGRSTSSSSTSNENVPSLLCQPTENKKQPSTTLSNLPTQERSGLTCIKQCFMDTSSTFFEEVNSFSINESSQVQTVKPASKYKPDNTIRSVKEEKTKALPKVLTYLSPCGEIRNVETLC